MLQSVRASNSEHIFSGRTSSNLVGDQEPLSHATQLAASHDAVVATLDVTVD